MQERKRVRVSLTTWKNKDPVLNEYQSIYPDIHDTLHLSYSPILLPQIELVIQARVYACIFF